MALKLLKNLHCLEFQRYATVCVSYSKYILVVPQIFLAHLQVTGLRPTLCSDLIITLTFTNDEFNISDLAYLSKRFPDDFQFSRKWKRRNRTDKSESLYTKLRVANIASRLDRNYALYSLLSFCIGISLHFCDIIFYQLGLLKCYYLNRYPG